MDGSVDCGSVCRALDSVVTGISTLSPVVSRLLRGIVIFVIAFTFFKPAFKGTADEVGSMIHSKGLTVEVCGEQHGKYLENREKRGDHTVRVETS